LQNRVEIRALTKEMHRDDRLGARRDRAFDFFNVDEHRIVAHIDEYGTRAGQFDCRDGCDRGVRHGNHFVARANAEREERDVNRFGARANADRVFDTDVLGKFFFKRFDLWTENVPAAFQHARDGIVEFGLDGFVLFGEVEERNHFTKPCLCATLFVGGAERNES
jgi:hypothetical protein